ncbi:hypothetical protein [Micromonospora sp. NPDC050695]|uniref:hypothetical protein n=1 Tax=Micromonospora sp. NPDC050695 TaxID=3154938 RepID=UPI0033DDEB4A
MAAPAWPTVMVTGHRPQDIPDDVHGWVQDKLNAGAVWLRDERGMTCGITPNHVDAQPGEAGRPAVPEPTPTPDRRLRRHP